MMSARASAADDVVLRGVPTNLSETHVAHALGLPPAAITRFHRSRRGRRTPLPLVRASVPPDTRDSLLSEGGRDVAGTWCSVEVPIAPSDGAAAAGSTRGTRAKEKEDAISACVERAVLVERSGAPKRWAPRVGELVYVRARPRRSPGADADSSSAPCGHRAARGRLRDRGGRPVWSDDEPVAALARRPEERDGDVGAREVSVCAQLVAVKLE